jgi:hypothetical protein
MNLIDELPVLLITSAAYIETELVAEYGKLPPAFLPLANRRLYLHQYDEFKNITSRVILTIPETYNIDLTDINILNDLNIEVLLIPENLSLGESIVYAINVSAIAGKSLIIIHGDTLLKGFDHQFENAVSVTNEPQIAYQWGGVDLVDGFANILATESKSIADAILTGLFKINNTISLVQSITKNNGSFINGLSAYGKEIPLKAVTCSEWFDFGHAGTYYNSKRRITTTRSFNSLSTTSRYVVKSGIHSNKIEAEACWFEEIPNQLRVYTPAYLGRQCNDDKIAYALEFLYMPTLADLFVFGNLSLSSWIKILDSCDEVLSIMAKFRPLQNFVADSDIYRDKTLQRLDLFVKLTGLDIYKPCRFNNQSLPSIFEMVDIAAALIPSCHLDSYGLLHGDFCFSNLLYDRRSGLIKMIDPRGIDSQGKFSIYGDPRYDIAKLCHSIVGYYDYIIAGSFQMKTYGELNFSLEFPIDNVKKSVSDEFMNFRFSGRKPNDSAALAISVLLFFSMLPLHSDNPSRQFALLANALRMFTTLDK